MSNLPKKLVPVDGRRLTRGVVLFSFKKNVTPTKVINLVRGKRLLREL